MDAVVFARQPIFDDRLRVSAYELLFRRPNQTTAQFVDGDHATARVVVGAFVDVGLDRVVGDHPAFINCTRSLLSSDVLCTLPPGRVVLEVLEDIDYDDDLLANMIRLRDLGYRFALDDFSWRPGAERVVPLADYVKLDVMALGLDGVAAQIKLLSGYRGTIIAEKVETQEEKTRCAELGCHLFQGYFLERPSNLDGAAMPASRQSILKLVARIFDPEVGLPEIERIIASDVGISFRVLRIINSAYYHMPREVTSIRQAIALLGLRFTRMWVSLIALADLGDAPAEVITGACIRARMCQRLAEITGRQDTDPYYISGLFSMLDAIVQRPLTDVVTDLPLTREVHDALLGKPGPIGDALSCVLALEKGRWEDVQFEKLDAKHVQQAYIEALTWAQQAREVLAVVAA
jgi:EAL and modified HD-GYP domain-containing signal transduction protein